MSLKYARYKARCCKSLHYCEVCKKNITFGQLYHDGGYGRRAHVDCVPQDKARIATLEAALARAAFRAVPALRGDK